MADVRWLADVLRAEGLRVIEMSGWKSRRTRPGFDPVGIVCHHTATGTNWSNDRVRQLLIDGREDLPGPLSQLGLERDGTFVAVAAGRCNHNGLAPVWANDSIGVEAYNDGRGEPWPAVQMGAYLKGCAAICRHMGWGVGNVRGHKETDPNRKIDPTFDMHQFRADLAPLIFPPIPTVPEDDDMAAGSLIKKAGDPKWWLSDGFKRRHITSKTEATAFALAGIARWNNGQAFVVPDDVIDRLPVDTGK